MQFCGEATGYIEYDGAAPVVAGPKLSTTRRKVLDALAPGMTWGEWRTAVGGSKDTFNGAVRWLRERGLTALDDATGTYTRNEFEISQAA